MSSPIEIPVEFPHSTFSAELLSNPKTFSDIMKDIHPTVVDIYVDDLYSRNSQGKIVFNFKLFEKLVIAMKGLPNAPTMYFLGCKENEITEDVVKAFAKTPGVLRAPSMRIVEAYFGKTKNGVLSLITMVSPFGNFSADGSPQMSLQLHNILTDEEAAKVPDCVFTSGERFIQGSKAITAILNFPPIMDDAVVKRIGEVAEQHSLKTPSGQAATTADEVNKAILALITDSTITKEDSSAKGLGQCVISDSKMFAGLNGADTKVIELNELGSSNIDSVGANSWKQALCYAQRSKDDVEFFHIFSFMIKHGITYIEAAAHGKKAFPDDVWGGCFSTRTHKDPLNTEFHGKPWYNCSGNGFMILKCLWLASLKGTHFDTNIKPTNEGGDKANPEFFDCVVEVAARKIFE